MAGKNTDDIYFTYNYDMSNRLINVSNEITQDNTYHLENTYDRDGNITKLLRYGDTNIVKDNFTYEYNSGTNKLNNVSGAKDQFAYDYNGNLNDDKLNKNYSFKYDHRNLISELYHKEGSPPTRVTLFATRYFYDESGNRIRKLIYTNLDENAGPVLDWNNLSNPGNGWTLSKNEFFVRGVNGNELATYNDTTLVEWYVQGNGIEGKIKGTTGYYYYKDHLGSVRAVVSDNGDLVSAQDYDAWGYLLEGRTFDSDSTKYKFTGKERDKESEYDYFGARYYDARIGRWGTIDPLMEKHYDFSPYNYVLDNPLIFYDQDGRDPYRKYLGSKEQVMNVIEQNKGKNYYEISTVFEKSTVRYIYTEKGGFIDLRHFFFAAFLSSFNSEQEAIIFMEGLEHGQFMFGNESANDPEDRPSNLVGARYGKNTDENDNYTNFKYFLEDQIIVDPSDPSISSEKIYIPYDENDVPLPARVSYKPYRGESLKNDDIKGTGKY